MEWFHKNVILLSSCLRGWSGTYCDKCETHSLCEHGTCKSPGECSCKNGWMGQNCDCPKCKEGEVVY